MMVSSTQRPNRYTSTSFTGMKFLSDRYFSEEFLMPNARNTDEGSSIHLEDGRF